MNTGITTSLFSIVALSESDVWIAGSSGCCFTTMALRSNKSPGSLGRGARQTVFSGPMMWLVGGGNAVWRYMP